MDLKKTYTVLLIIGGASLACAYIYILFRILAGRDFLDIALFPIMHILLLEASHNKLLVISGMVFGAVFFISLRYLAKLVPRFLLGIVTAAIISLFLYGINHFCGTSLLPACFGQKSVQIESGPFILMMILGAFIVLVIGNIVLLCYKLSIRLLQLTK